MSNQRIALVIGNAAYQHATLLETPINDVAAMEAALQRLNFDVRTATDCTISDFQKELRLFTSRIDGSAVALFYYSGHALQYGGENHIIPVDARLEEVDDLQRLAFQVTPCLRNMRSKAAVSLVFLDACRDDPFDLEKTETAEGTKRVIIKPIGLRTLPSKELRDAFIAYAAEEGSTAADGDPGGLSPFTKALCEHIETPGLDLGGIMRCVKKSVGEATQNSQRPWSNDSLTSAFFFKPADGIAPPAVQIERTVVVSSEKPYKTDDETTPQEPEEPPNQRPILGISTRLPNLAAGIEAVAINTGPVALGISSMMIFFALLFISQLFNLALIQLPGSGKQVGFMTAPNWLIVYLILFPFYLYLFAVLAARIRITLVSLVKQRVIVDKLERPVTEQRLFSAWKEAQKNISIWLWGMLAFIVVQTSSEWWRTCFLPYYGSNVIALDWATSAIHGSEAERVQSMVFSAAAYLYMGVALYVYLAILVYAVTACIFFNTLADPTGEFRLILRDETPGKQFSYIGTVIYWSVILGLGAGFMMRLQAIYLGSGHLIVTDLLFNDVWTWLGQPPAMSASATGGTLPSAWTGFFEMIFTLLILFGCCVSLYNALDNARQYYLDHINSSEWRERMGINPTRDETDRIRRQPILKTLFPMYVHFGFIVAGIVAGGVFIGYGVIVLATLAYLVVAFMILPGFRGDGAAAVT